MRPKLYLTSTEHLVFIVIVIVVSIGWAHRIWKFWFQTRFRSLVVFAILCWSILIVTYVDLPPADKHCRNFFASIFLAVIASARWSFLPLHISL